MTEKICNPITKITKPAVKKVGSKRILVFSDVHLLHKRVPTWHVVLVLMEMISACGDTVDALYIAGDLFDDSRYLRQDESREAIAFLLWLLAWCKQTNTALRVLEGTPSHDHQQSKIILDLNQPYEIDVRYLSGIGIFYDPVLETHVGWVEDEFGDKVAEHTEQAMTDLMATHGIEKVGFFFMHGVFTFQLPISSPICFTERFWLDRCVYGIYIGHDHREKTLDRIRVMGSVERLAQGEEEDKGMTLVDFNEHGFRNYFFVNTKACPQLTVRADEDYERQYQACLEALSAIDRHPSSAVGRLKIEYYRDSPIVANIAKWKKDYVFHIESARVNTNEEEERLEAVFSPEMVMEENITAENTERIMTEEMSKLGMVYDKAVVAQLLGDIL